MPGSPEPDNERTKPGKTRALHPLAWLLSLALLMSGLAMTHSWIDLAGAVVLLACAALRAEARRVRDEAPLLLLALVVFLAHVLGAGKDYRAAIAPAALIAFRLLALLYLLRWAARVALGPCRVRSR